LGREVAIKVLPAELASDSDRLKRFEKEVRSASSLNHPNIVTVYDFGQVDSVSYIAMELVDGKTLREILAAGPLPIRKLLGIAAQIADGLARAHEAGITHRDLKPENVMATGDGRVKILDFGLAKATRPASDSSDSQFPTMTRGTEAGVVMGTVGYMSPEQASGHAVDFRSDQFSFGSILYEMATGKRAFQRATAPQTLAAIIEGEPEPIATLNPAVPVPLRWLVERCLAKEPSERYDSTRDLARDLARLRDGISEASLSGGVAAAAGSRPSHQRRILITTGLLLAGLVLFAGARLVLRTSVEPPRFRALTFRRGLIPSARFSPDGRTVVYGAGWEGRPIELFAAQPPAPDSRPMGLPPASILAISSTGEMAISMGCRFELSGRHSCLGTLARASLSGGAPRELLERVHQADWSPDGKDLAVVRREGGGTRLEFPIGHVLRKSSGWIGQPRLSPRGDAIAFFERAPNIMGGAVSVLDVRTGKAKSLSSGWQFCPGLAWSPSGDEVWFTAVPLKDPESGALFAVSMGGKLRTVERGAGALRLQDIAKDGRVLMTLDSIRAGLNGFFPGDAGEHDYSWFGFSVAKDLTPDGRFLLFSELGARAEYFRKTDGSAAVSLGDASTLTLSPDAKWIVTFVPEKGERPHLELVPSGPGERRVLPNSSLENYESAFWFSDGGRLSIEAQEKGRRLRCYEQAIDAGEAKPLTPEGTHQCLPGPDGRILFAQDDQGKKFIFPLGGGEIRAVPALAPDDEVLQWTSDSSGLYFRKRGVPGQIERIDLASGRREPAKDLRPADPAGILGLDEMVMTPGGRFYAYSYRRVLSELYIVEGLH
jgi:hypothetical protein